MKSMKREIFNSIPLPLISIMLFFSCAKRDTSTLIEEIKPAVVTIITFGVQEKQGLVSYWQMDTLSQGSGFFINSNGYAVTNYHVLEGADSAIIKTINNKVYSISGIVAEDRIADLLIVATTVPQDSFKYVKLSKELPKEGENVLVIGSPLGFEHTTSNGIVSSIRNTEAFGELIQITAPISPGSSGGPVINQKGKVIGVASYKASGGLNLNFAISGKKVLILNQYPFEEKDLCLWTAEIIADEITDVEELLRRGYLNRFNFRPAYIYLTKAQNVAPNNPDVYAEISWLYYTHNRDSFAIEYIKRAIQLDPYNCIWFYRLSQYQNSLEQYEDAIQNLKKAIKYATDDLSYTNFYLSSLADVYRKAGEYQNAIRTRKQWIEHYVRQYYYRTFRTINGFYVCDDSYINNYLYENYSQMASDYYLSDDTTNAIRIWKFLEERNARVKVTAERLRALFENVKIRNTTKTK